MKIAALALLVAPLFGQVNVTTWGYDNANSHANTSEAALTWSILSGPGLKKVCTYTTSNSGPVWGQVLVLGNTPITGHRHVGYVATMKDRVEAFDADTCAGIWVTNLTAESGTDQPWTNYDSTVSSALYGNPLGALATPVIDLANGRIWVLYATGGSGATGIWTLKSLSIIDGSLQSTTVISGTINSVAFNPTNELGRAGLLLANGTIYTAWASGVDEGAGKLWRDWILGYDVSTQAQISYCGACSASVPAGQQYNNCIWMSGSKMAADGSGNVYVMTANPSTQSGDGHTSVNLTDSFIKLTSTLGSPTAYNPVSGDTTDLDLGSTGPMLIGNSFVFGAGKSEQFYLQSQSSMANTQNFLLTSDMSSGPGNLSGPRSEIFADNNYYVSLTSGQVYRYAFNTGTNLFATSPNATSTVGPISPGFFYPGCMMAYSSNSGNTGSQILWCVYALGGSANTTVRAASLVALKGTDLTQLFDTNAAGISLGNMSKYAMPTIANGHVLIGTNDGTVVNLSGPGGITSRGPTVQTNITSQ